MEITYYLKDGKAKKETPLYALIYLAGGKTLKYYIGEKILPADWNPKEYKARKTLAGYADFNELLNKRAAQIKTLHRAFVTVHGCEPTPEQFREELDTLRPNAKKIKAEAEKAHRETLLGFFDHFIKLSTKGIRTNKEGRAIEKATLRNYQTTYNTLRDFEAIQKKTYALAEIDLNFYDDFKGYLTITKELAANSIGKHIRILKTLLNEAVSREIIAPISPTTLKGMKAYNGETEAIFLSEAELKALEDLDLSDAPRLERVRDLFLIGAYTGARFSDWNKITPAKVDKEDNLTIRAQKTDATVKIPVLPPVRRIFNKYGDEMPRLPTNQKVNAFLKEIGQRLACLQKEETKTLTKGGAKQRNTFQKWELLTTHTARRSFATNAYNRKINTLAIMSVTGHKTEASFRKYIRVTDSDHANNVREGYTS